MLGLLRSKPSSDELQSHPWLMVPGLFIIVAVLSFNFVGDARGCGRPV